MSSVRITEWLQGPVGSLLALAVIAGISIVLVFGLVTLIRAVGRWILGRGSRQPRAEKIASPPARVPPSGPPSGPFVVTAADIMAIKSNLDAVSRQLGDLELKLRLNSPKRDAHGD